MPSMMNVPHPDTADAWAEHVPGVGAFLTQDLPDESRLRSNLDAAFTVDVDDFQGHLERLGSVPLSGPLVACDPVTTATLELPVEVNPGYFPAYVVVGDYADLLLVRLGAARPTEWYEWTAPNGRSTIPIDTGSYAVCGQSLLEAAKHNPAVSDRLREPSGPEAVDFGDGLGMVINGDLGGDVPAWCYVGLDGGTVVALVVALVTDYEQGNMPAELDQPLLDSLERHVAATKADEEFVGEWTMLQKRLRRSNGQVTRDIRAVIHGLVAQAGITVA